MGLNATKPVFGISDKVSFKPDSSASETSWKIEISPVASLHMILPKMQITKGTDQTARMCRLVCDCVVSKTHEDRFSHVKAQKTA